MIAVTAQFDAVQALHAANAVCTCTTTCGPTVHVPDQPNVIVV